MKSWTAIITIVVILVAAALWFINSGTYNIAATQADTAFGRWLLTTVRDQSINEHANGINAPKLTDSSLVQSGAQHYAESCVICHGAPGQELSEIAKGLNPPPPSLHTGEVQQKYSDAELYWIVEHGIRMTGMPAFGPTHKDEDLWAITAFIKRLPDMDPNQYKSMANTAGHDDSASEHHFR